MTGYVDDCGGQTNEWCVDPIENTERLQAKVTHDAQCWTNLLSVTGGTLALPKCSVHIVQWQYTITGAPVFGSSQQPLTHQGRGHRSSNEEEPPVGTAVSI